MQLNQKRINEITSRTQRFYDSKNKGIMQIQVKNIKNIELPKKPLLNSFDFPTDMEKYLAMRVSREEAFWDAREGIDDDLIPAIAPFYGIAEHTAFLGGEVDITTDTSYHHSVMEDINDYSKISLDENNMWLKLVVDGIKYYRENHSDKFIAKFRGADGPSDIANALRGNDIFYDIYDYPDELAAFMDFCADALNFTLDRQQKQATVVNGGYVTGFGIWLPGNSAGHLSEDASCMMSPDTYEEHFFPFYEKAVNKYDSVMLHTHSLGKKCLNVFAKSEKTKLIEISNDPNSDRAIDVMREYKDVLRDKIVVIDATKKEIEENLDLFAEMKTLLWYNAESVEEAKYMVDFVREKFANY